MTTLNLSKHKYILLKFHDCVKDLQNAIIKHFNLTLHAKEDIIVYCYKIETDANLLSIIRTFM